MADNNKITGANLSSLKGIIPKSRIVPTPSLNFQMPVSKTNPAKWTYERLAEYVTNFQNDLDEEHEVGGYLANFPNGVVHFTNVGYWGPDIVTFDGHSSDGNKVKLIQNIAQLNITLVAVPKINEKPTRIGFNIPNQDDE